MLLGRFRVRQRFDPSLCRDVFNDLVGDRIMFAIVRDHHAVIGSHEADAATAQVLELTRIEGYTGDVAQIHGLAIRG